MDDAIAQVTRSKDLEALGHGLRSLPPGIAAVIGAARTPGTEIKRRLVALDRQHLDVFGLQSEFFGGDLRENGLLPSSGISAAKAHQNAAIGEDINGIISAVTAFRAIGSAGMQAAGDTDAPARARMGLLVVPVDRN